ncbi:hypothetical protein BN1263170276 [Stenotrophomonas maltophilia]|nr:hypothetical protein BN1263170276 [Stenotrophomonas maltophilia]
MLIDLRANDQRSNPSTRIVTYRVSVPSPMSWDEFKGVGLKAELIEGWGIDAHTPT